MKFEKVRGSYVYKSIYMTMLNLIRLKIILTAIYGVFYHSRSPSYTFSHLIHIGALWRGSLPFPHPPGGRKKRSIYLLLDCTSLFYKYLIHTYIHKILTVKYVLSMFMSLQVRLTLLLNRRTRFVGPRSPVLLLVLLQLPPPPRAGIVYSGPGGYFLSKHH